MSKTRCIATTIFAALMSSVAAGQTFTNSEYSGQTSLAQIGVTPELHALLNGAGMGIVNIDGYPDVLHPDLAGNVTIMRMFGSMTQYDLKTSWATNHATHVVGIMVGLKNDSGIVGVAPQARVYDYPIWSETGTWTGGPVSNLRMVYDSVRALNAGGANISVINQEFQFARYQSGAYLLEGVFAAGELTLMDDYRDFVFVRAAGNQGKVLLNQNYELGAGTYLDHLILVGSVNSSNVISTFSNRPAERCFYKVGETVCREAEKLKNFFVVAPGDGILSSVYGPTTQKWYGTSMAAPHVAAEVALIAQDANNKNVKLTAPQIAAIVKESAKDLGAPGVDGVYGWGLINVQAALAPIGPLAPAVVAGQVSFDKFGRPYAVSPTPVAVAPQTGNWQAMMMGERKSLALQDGLALTTRQAVGDGRSSLMTGLEQHFRQFAFGLAAGALSETSSLMGNLSDRSNLTRLAGVDASWTTGTWKLAAFYSRGHTSDYAASAYGIGVSYRSLQLDVVKPLSIISATVPTGLNLDGSVAYATLPGERPWAAMLKFKREF